MLSAREVTVRYGEIVALRNVTLDLAPGEIVSVVGPNTAGKTTLCRTMLGTVRSSGGAITMDDVDVSAWTPRERIAGGLSIVPEGRGIVGSLSTLDNLLLGGWCMPRGTVRKSVDRVLCQFPELARRAGVLAGDLSGGEQQLLAIARALVSDPRYILLDEPCLGLDPANATRVLRLLRELRAERGVLVLDQVGTRAFYSCDRAFYLRGGQIRVGGRPVEVERFAATYSSS